MKKLSKYLLVLVICAVIGACNKDQQRPAPGSTQFKANETLMKEMKSSAVVKQDYTIRDIPLKVTYRPQQGGAAIEQSNRTRSNLKKLGFAGLAENKSKQIANRTLILKKFDQLSQAGGLDEGSFELQAAIIMRDHGLLQDSSKAARASVRRYLDKLLDIRSSNIALEYFALKAIEKDLDESEVQQYASRIIQVNDTEKEYRSAVKLKEGMLSRMDDPDFMERKGALTALQLWKLINNIIIEHDYYQAKLKTVADHT